MSLTSVKREHDLCGRGMVYFGHHRMPEAPDGTSTVVGRFAVFLTLSSLSEEACQMEHMDILIKEAFSYFFLCYVFNHFFCCILTQPVSYDRTGQLAMCKNLLIYITVNASVGLTFILIMLDDLALHCSKRI